MPVKVKECLSKIKSDAVHKRTIQGRNIKDAFRGETAAQTIGDLYPGCEIYGFTKGQFCLIHILEHVLNQTHPADVNICTWSASSGDIRATYRLMQQQDIKNLRFLVDFSFQARKPKFCNELIETFGPDCIRVTSIHAKFMTVKTPEYNLTIRTSMNLNYNARFENFEISDDPNLLDFMAKLMDEIWKTQDAYEGFKIRPADVQRQFKNIYQPQSEDPQALLFPAEVESVDIRHLEGIDFKDI